MLVVVAYDISDDRRRNRVAVVLEGYGQRVQESVFECWMDSRQLAELQSRLNSEIDAHEDRVRFYRLCRKDTRAVIWDGLGGAPRDCTLHVI